MRMNRSLYKILITLVIFLICSMSPACAVQYSNMNDFNTIDVPSSNSSDECGLKSDISSCNNVNHGIIPFLPLHISFSGGGFSCVKSDYVGNGDFFFDGPENNITRHGSGFNGKPPYLIELILAVAFLTSIINALYNAYTLSLAKDGLEAPMGVQCYATFLIPVGFPIPEENMMWDEVEGSALADFVPDIPYARPFPHTSPTPLLNPLVWIWMNTLQLQEHFNNPRLFRAGSVQPRSNNTLIEQDNGFNSMSMEQMKQCFNAYKMSPRWERMMYDSHLNMLNGLSPLEVAEKLKNTSPEEAAYILAHISSERAAQILIHIDSEHAANILTHIDETTRIMILNELCRVSPETAHEITNILALRGHGVDTSMNNNGNGVLQPHYNIQHRAPFFQLGLTGLGRGAVFNGIMGAGNVGAAVAQLKGLDPLDIAEILKLLDAKRAAEILNKFTPLMRLFVLQYLGFPYFDIILKYLEHTNPGQGMNMINEFCDLSDKIPSLKPFVSNAIELILGCRYDRKKEYTHNNYGGDVKIDSDHSDSEEETKAP